TTQHEKGDSLAKGYISELWDFARISVTQKSLQELKEIWDQWNDKKGDSKYIPWKNLKDNSSTPRYEEEGRGLCFEYIRLSCLPQDFWTC
ncbi:hypothetical protein Godav_011545, partial [Gossypium davidsonii]|nr:hypothetical protein [Gossypium davidsonii]